MLICQKKNGTNSANTKCYLPMEKAGKKLTINRFTPITAFQW